MKKMNLNQKVLTCIGTGLICMSTAFGQSDNNMATNSKNVASIADANNNDSNSGFYWGFNASTRTGSTYSGDRMVLNENGGEILRLNAKSNQAAFTAYFRDNQRLGYVGIGSGGSNNFNLGSSQGNLVLQSGGKNRINITPSGTISFVDDNGNGNMVLSGGNVLLNNTIKTRGMVIGNTLNFGSHAMYVDSNLNSYFKNNLGIGVLNPQEKLDVNGTVLANNLLLDNGGELKSRGRLILQPDANNTGSDDVIDFKNSNGDTMATLQDGTLVANEVVLNIGTFPDYVFENDYKLMPLKEVAAFIKTNKHLPNVPTEATVVANGLNLKQINTILVEKVEELTLHTIAQEEKIVLLMQQFKALKTALEASDFNK